MEEVIAGLYEVVRKRNSGMKKGGMIFESGQLVFEDGGWQRLVNGGVFYVV